MDCTDKIKELNNMTNEDPEMNHKRADDILLEVLTAYGEIELVAAYSKIKKWYA